MTQDPKTGQSPLGAEAEETLTQAAPQMPLPPLAPPDLMLPAGGLFAPQQSAVIGSGIGLAWATQTTFVLMLISLILLVILVAASPNGGFKQGLVVWTYIIIVAINLIYPLAVFSMARRSASAAAPRWPFQSPFRRP